LLIIFKTKTDIVYSMCQMCKTLDDVKLISVTKFMHTFENCGRPEHFLNFFFGSGYGYTCGS